MPQLQTVDLRAPPRTEQTTLEKTLQGFASRHRQNQIEEQETDALSQIYKKYQEEGRMLDDAIMSVQTRPGLSPTTRVNTVNQLLGMQKTNAQLQQQAVKENNVQEQKKQVQERARLEKEERDVQEEKERKALEMSNASPEQIALYQVAPVGGKTDIVKDIVETNARKQGAPGVTSPTLEDFDRGLTPAERVKRQDQRYTTQTPLVNKNNDSIAALESESMSINLLDELNESKKVGQGLNKININPKTGDLFLPQAATAEEQLFVKTVNDFTVKAKDSFGARVTNFELDRFMQRLPTLANSEEGRKLILRQMKIINQLNQMDKRAVQNVFDEYGIRNIDYADAENKSRKKISADKEALRKEFFNIEQLAKKEDENLVTNVKEKVLTGYTALRKPDGTIKQFPTKNVPNLLEKGYKNL